MTEKEIELHQELNSLKGKHGGKMSAISSYLDDVNVPNLDTIQARVKWAVLRLKELEIENQRLKLK